MTKANPLPEMLTVPNIRNSGGEMHGVTCRRNERVEFLAVFFNTSGNIGDAPCSCYKNFHFYEPE